VRSASNTISCRYIVPILALTALLHHATFAQDVAPQPTSSVAWSVELPAAPMFPPVIAGDRVYVAHLPGLVSVHAIDDGRVLWRADLRPDAPIVVDEDPVLVAAGEAMHALRAADGAALWRVPSGAVTVRPVAKEGWVVVTAAGKLLALRAADGSTVWTRDVPHLRRSPAISGNTVIVAAADGWIRLHDLRTGEVTWERRVGGAPAEPLVVNDRIYFGASDRNFYCIDALNGEILWHYRIGAAMPTKAASDGDRVYHVALDNLVRAHDASDGHLEWQQGVPFRPFAGPALAGGLVLIAGPVPGIRPFRPANGGAAPVLSFPVQLAAAPGIGEGPAGIRIVAVSGSLKEAWKLSLITPETPKAEGPAAK
jgi:outer membrane protein assembly factor BamB